MPQPVIAIESLSKQYRLGEIGTGTLTHDLNRWWRRIRGKEDPYLKIGETNHLTRAAREESGNRGVKADSAASATLGKQAFSEVPSDYVFALRDINVEVDRGEILGVIGRNGAGKSTLLKVLSRVTAPTSGQVKVKGRIAALLEVGTGFHPDLSGRENIYLNGAILGMRSAEIRSNFDAIVDFAAIERYVDTPVKRYSSGMYVRLAFAVAAHLESEILVFDEVLAVGDANFQKKCLAKMEDVSREGRTVLFVSHNMHAISLLCRRAIVLKEGLVAADGPTAQVVGKYLESHANQSAEAVWTFGEAPGTENVRLRAVRAIGGSDARASVISIDEPIRLEVEFWVLRRTRMTPSFHISNAAGTLLFAVSNVHDVRWAEIEYAPGAYLCGCTIPGNLLNEGRHYVTVYLTRDNNAGLIDVLEKDAISFETSDLGKSRGTYVREWVGLVRPVLPWTQTRIRDLPSPVRPESS